MSGCSCGLRYKDKVCIITGGTQGIGEGCVRTFVNNGAKVVFCGLGEDPGRTLEAELRGEGTGEAHYLPCDVTDEQQIRDLIQKTVDMFGRIDCLLNNAGFHPPHRSIDDDTSDQFRDLFGVNVLGYYLTCKYALPHLRKTQGCIINASSLVAHIGQSLAVPYVATKGAVTSMTKAMAIDEAKYGVRVLAFSPSNVMTPMWKTLADDSVDTEKTIKDGKEAQLLGRMGRPDEIGQLCLFLAAEGTFMTGCDVMCTGGAELSYGRKSIID